MKALITGASSGIGRDMAYYLASKGYDLILVARRENRLLEVQKNVKVKTRIIILDLSDIQNAYKLHEMTKDENIDFLINDAGVSVFGFTHESDMDKELSMIDLNIKSLFILTKLFLKDFVERDSGRILNVGSSAGFFAGPKCNAYYASKNFVNQFSLAIYEELRHKTKNVHISVLCPGPTNTEFNQVGHGHFNTIPDKSKFVAKCAIDKALKNKVIIIPGIKMKLMVFFNRHIPILWSLKVSYRFQDIDE